MGMRITNGIINNNTKTNVILNKEYADKYNTMVATGQKITRPSDDPIVAIRALRLNNNISEINQFYGKNIPDAEAWIEITETALKQTEGVLSSVQSNLTQGASDDNTAEDRKNILENLKGLRDQIYASGNADYAGRTVFTGYRTSESLTYLNSENQRFTIVQNFTNEALENIKYVKGDRDYDPADPASIPADYDQTDVSNVDVSRIRLAYENLAFPQDGLEPGETVGNSLVIKDKDGNDFPGSPYTVTPRQLTTNKEDNDKLYLSQSDGGDVPDDGVIFIVDTGELIMGKNVAANMRLEGSTASFEYAKEEWEKNDPRPEHYFAAKTIDNDVNPPRMIRYNYTEEAPYEPDFKYQKIQYEIAYNQKVEINVNAGEVYTPYITRDVDELLKVTQACQDSYERLEKIKAARDAETDETTKKKLSTLCDAAQKEYDLYKDNMQKTFSKSITIFKDYTDDLNNKIAALGSLDARVKLTKSRVNDQLENFKELADSNINVELTESAIDLKNAEIALEAAQQAAAKVAKVSLLNYL